MSKPTARQKRILTLQTELERLYEAERDALYDRVRAEAAPLVALLTADPHDKGGLAGSIWMSNSLRFAGLRGKCHIALRIYEWEGKVGIALDIDGDALTPERVREFLESLPPQGV